MVEVLPRRSALEGALKAGTFGAGGTPGLTLSERRRLAIVHVAGDAGDPAFTDAVRGQTGLDLPIEANTTATGGGRTILWLAPNRWLVVCAGEESAALETGLRDALGSTFAAVNDVSQGRTVIRVAGARARDLLAKGCPLDLHASAFPTGACGQSSLAKINVLVHSVDSGADAPILDVYVARGFALSLWEFLTDGAGEFGYTISLLP